MKITNIFNWEDEDETYAAILHWIEARIHERIPIGTFGAMRTNYEATRGYYLVKWISEPYTVQAITIMKGVGPHHTSFVV